MKSPKKFLQQEDLFKAILRIAFGLVFVYFGYAQVSDPDSWAGFVPEFLTSIFITGNNIVVLNGILELVLGTLLIIGLFVRISALILGVHLLFIALSIGFNPLGMRDFGLAVATLYIFTNGPDNYCLDRKII